MDEYFKTEEDDVLLNPNLYPMDVRQLFLQQNAIKWRQIFIGRFSLKCKRMHQQAYRYYPQHQKKAKNQRRNGTQWQVKLTLNAWEQWHQVWGMKNLEVHGQQDGAAMTRAQAERAAFCISGSEGNLQPGSVSS